MSVGERPIELLVYGASGFSGRRATEYLSRRAGSLGLRWAICGRDAGKLDALARSLPEPRPQVLVADAREPEQLKGICHRVSALISLVGPHAPLGDELPAQCVAAGTHYADLCGENDVIATRVASLHQPARASRVRLICACGFESVPFDLGVLALHEAFRGADGSVLQSAQAEVRFILGGHLLRLGRLVSGGTMATIVRLIEAGDLTDPHRFVDAAGADGEIRAVDTAHLHAVRSPGGDWMAPIMPTPFLNPAIIQLTGKRLEEYSAVGYAPTFHYGESMNLSASIGSTMLSPVVAKAYSSLMRRIVHMSAQRRRLADRATLLALRAISPAPGRGPSPRSLATVDYEVRLQGHSSSDLRGDAIVHGLGHPGYLSSPSVLAEVGIALARDRDLPQRFGVLTPASALGSGFFSCLRPAGLQLEMHQPVPVAAP
jgi:short subunit dehydrogenase-like uncharacterized protein